MTFDPPPSPPTVRIRWWEDGYRLECEGQGPDLRLSVFDGSRRIVEEAVESASAAVKRGHAIVERLRRERPGPGERPK
jgi:hypothetical protein